jgi:hypothetical protein
MLARNSAAGFSGDSLCCRGDDHGAQRNSRVARSDFLALSLPSGATFTVTRGHASTLLAAGLLSIEVVKSTSGSTASLVENGLAFVVFIVAFIVFLLSPPLGTIEFALIIAMMLIDFMAGACCDDN